MRFHLGRQTRNGLQRGALLASSLTFVGLSCTMGPSAECRSYLDCSSNETCDTESGNCVSLGGGPLGDGTSAAPGSNSTTTNPNNNQPLRTSYVTTGPIQYISASPDGVQTDVLVFSEPITTDLNAAEKVRELDVRANATRDMSIFLDLEALQLTPCEVSALHKLTSTNPAETWISCRRTNETYIVYEGRELQGQETLNHQSDFFITLPSSASGDWNRVVAVGRGSSTLRSYQLRTGAGDGPGIGHPFQDEIPQVNGPIYGLWSATSDNDAADTLVVFARGNSSTNASLQFLERFSRIETWNEVVSPSAFGLPKETYLIHFMTAPHLTPNDLGNNDATLLSIEPQSGTVRFWNFNGQREIFPSLQYENDTRYLFDPGSISVTNAIALTTTRDGQYVFLAHPAGHRIWRLPTQQDRGVEDVRWWDAEDANLEIASIAPVSDVEMWVGYRNESRLDLATFSQ